jgi:hypothetical protein
VLRLTWERPLRTWATWWSTLQSTLAALSAGLPGWQLRVVLPLEVDDHADDAVLLEVCRQLGATGVGVDLSPRVGGLRAVNTATASTFQARLLASLELLSAGLHDVAAMGIVPGVVVHLEPSGPQVNAVLEASRGPFGRRVRGVTTTIAGMASAIWTARQGRRDLLELVRDLRALPWPVLATSPPPLLPLDTIAGARALPWLLGCPDTWGDDVDGGLFGPTSALCFAPLLGSVVGARDRAEQHRALTLWAARHREHSHAVCLGPFAAPAGFSLGDDAVYQSPGHLRQDLQAVRALGFVDVMLTGFDGLVLTGEGTLRPKDERSAWLHAITDSAVSDLAA